MKVSLNEDESCTITMNHKDSKKTHCVVIGYLQKDQLNIREFNPPEKSRVMIECDIISLMSDHSLTKEDMLFSLDSIKQSVINDDLF